MQHVLVLMQLSAPSVSARRETFMGRSFRVVPAVMVRSQVLNNNMGRSFLPPDEVTDEWAAVWNGIPVLVGPHPEERGQPVTGRSPVLWNERGAGWLFNVKAGADGTDRALRGEVWLDEGRADAVNGLTAVLERIDAGQAVELSTGFPARSEEVVGVHNGETYELIMRPAGADHLVISTEMTGACAVADGCGLGVNSEVAPMDEDKDKGEKNRFMAIFAKMGALLNGPSPQQAQWDENTALRLAREVTMLNATLPSDQDRWNMLREALQAKHGGQDRAVAVMDVYSDLKQVVFYVNTPLGAQPPGTEYFRAEYAEAENGALTFTDPETVRRMTSYEPSVRASANLATNGKPACGCHHLQEEAPMDDKMKAELANEISTNLVSQFGEMLKPLTESIAAVANTAHAAATTAVNAAVESLKVEFKTQLDAVNAKVDGALAPIVAEREAEKTALVEHLSTNERTPFSKEELVVKSVGELQKIAQMANVQVSNFSGRGGPRLVENSKEEAGFAEPVPYFQKTATNSGSKE